MKDRESEHDRTEAHVVLPRGTVVAHYTILERIGMGAMGDVYLADDSKLKRRVALKLLPLQYMPNAELKARFRREAQAAAALNHPNIVTIHEVNEHQGRPFFAMEYVAGRSLKEVLKEEELPIERVVNLAIQMCEGLREAHHAGIVHRDVKPSNILIDKNGRPRIVDFGLAAVRGEEDLTTTGSTLGTIPYMSPEQVHGKEMDQRSDLFSFGVVLYEMIAGRAPFTRETAAATINAILNSIPEPLARYKSGLPPGFEEIVGKALDKDVETRYQSADGLMADLKRQKRLLESGPMASVPATQERSKFRKFLVPAAAVAAILLAVPILWTFFVLKPWKGPEEQKESASPVTSLKNRLAVMYFDNLADPEDTQRLGEMTTNLLIADLAESSYLEVVSSQRLYDILRQLGKEGPKEVDPGMATEVARKAEARWMLAGNILQVEPQIVLSSQLVEVATGNAIGSQRVTGEDNEDVFALVDQLSVEVKKDLPLPEEALAKAAGRGGDIGTRSSEAYRYYLDALDNLRNLEFEKAEVAIAKALEYDSQFGGARLNSAQLSLLREGRELAAKAAEYSKKVSSVKKLLGGLLESKSSPEGEESTPESDGTTDGEGAEVESEG